MRIVSRDERAAIVASLPSFVNYDEAELAAWCDALIAIVRKQYEEDWRYDAEKEVRSLASEAVRVRERVARGEAQLRPMPTDGLLPSWAVRLESVLVSPYFPHRTGSADGGAGSGNYHWPTGYSSVPERTAPEPKVYVVPAALAREPEAAQPSLPAQARPGRKRLSDEVIRSQGREVQAKLDNGDTLSSIARDLEVNEKTVRDRRDRYQRLASSSP